MIIFDKIILFCIGIYLNETSNNWKTLAMKLNPTLLTSSQIQQPCIQVNCPNTFFFSFSNDALS